MLTVVTEIFMNLCILDRQTGIDTANYLDNRRGRAGMYRTSRIYAMKEMSEEIKSSASTNELVTQRLNLNACH